MLDLVEIERDKYREMWEVPQYSDFSPGLSNVDRFMRIMQPDRGESLIDIGCGKGVAGLEFEKLGLNVSYLDLINLLPPGKLFIKSALWGQWRRHHPWDYGFCCDVLEHIPPEFTMLSIDRILSNCRRVWFQIAFAPDQFGRMIGKELHLTVQPFTWWRDRISGLGSLVEARDLCGHGLFIVRRD